MRIDEVLSTTVLIPQWYLVIVALGGVLIGLVVLLAAWQLYTRLKLRSNRLVDDVGVRISAGESADGSDKPAPEPAAKRVPLRPVAIGTTDRGAGERDKDTGAPHRLSPEQIAELNERVRLGGGFLLDDTAQLLREGKNEIQEMIKQGDLVMYRDTRGRSWITAASIAKLCDQESTQPKPKSSAPRPSRSGYAKPPIRQHYWYRVDDKPERYVTLAEALETIPEYTGQTNTDWMRLPMSIRERISREKLER